MARDEKIANAVKEIAAEYIGKIDSPVSLITVTAATVSPDLKRGTIFITVLPDSQEKSALSFVQHNLGGLRDALKEKLLIKTIPFLEAKIDEGEKNRQKIDELLRK